MPCTLQIQREVRGESVLITLEAEYGYCGFDWNIVKALNEDCEPIIVGDDWINLTEDELLYLQENAI